MDSGASMTLAARTQRNYSKYWTPSQDAPLLKTWWIADSPLNSKTGDILNNWYDNSGNNYTLNPFTATAANRGRLISNFLNGRGVSRGQTSDSLRSQWYWDGNDMSSGVLGFTMFIVHKQINDTGNTDAPVMSIDVGGQGSGRIYIGRGSFGNGSVYAGGRRLDADAGTWAQDTTNYSNNWLILGVRNDYASGTITLSVNGKLSYATFPSKGGTNITSSYSQSFGHQNTASQDSYIAEGMVRTGAMTDAMMRRYEGYLAAEYGLQSSLIAGHPYKTNRP